MAAVEPHTSGILPATNDLIAGAAVLGAYITRFGALAEGVGPSPWLLPLYLTTDLLLPLLGALWFVAVPMYRVYQNYQE